jgi:hypothetical protein
MRACSYIDRLLSIYTFVPNQLQLLGVVCLNISLKYHGITFRLDKLLYYTADSVPKNLVLVSLFVHLDFILGENYALL